MASTVWTNWSERVRKHPGQRGKGRDAFASRALRWFVDGTVNPDFRHILVSVAT